MHPCCECIFKCSEMLPRKPMPNPFKCATREALSQVGENVSGCVINERLWRYIAGWRSRWVSCALSAEWKTVLLRQPIAPWTVVLRGSAFFSRVDPRITTGQFQVSGRDRTLHSTYSWFKDSKTVTITIHVIFIDSLRKIFFLIIKM